MKRVSIKNIAEELGISNATVSLVLSGKATEGRVRKEMCERIKHTAKLMNYQPNGLARSLRIGRSQTIGLIVADISNPFFGVLALHIQEEAEKFGYTVIIANTNESDVKMGEMIEILRCRQVDGYIIVPTEHGDRFVAELMESKAPLVLVDRYFPAIRTSNVVVDNYQASYEAAELLIKAGCNRIALFVYESELSHMRERRNGYTDALNKASLFDPELIFEVDYTRIKEAILKGMDTLFSSGEPIDGIFFSTNSISVIGIKEMLRRGVKIQENLRVVCFDKSDTFDFMRKPIPYVKQPIAGMGRKAVDILIEQITRKDTDIDLVMCRLSAKLIS